MKIPGTAAILLTMLLSRTASAAGVTYLTCNVPGSDGSPDRVFDFTLDEANSTVTFYVKDANIAGVRSSHKGSCTVRTPRTRQI